MAIERSMLPAASKLPLKSSGSQPVRFCTPPWPAQQIDKKKRGPAHPSRPPLLSVRKSYLNSNPAESEMNIVFESSAVVSSLSKIMCHLPSIIEVKPLNGTSTPAPRLIPPLFSESKSPQSLHPTRYNPPPPMMYGRTVAGSVIGNMKTPFTVAVRTLRSTSSTTRLAVELVVDYLATNPERKTAPLNWKDLRMPPRFRRIAEIPKGHRSTRDNPECDRIRLCLQRTQRKRRRERRRTDK